MEAAPEVMVPITMFYEILAEEERKGIVYMTAAKDLLSLGEAQGAYKVAKRLQETFYDRVKNRKGVILDGLQR